MPYPVSAVRSKGSTPAISWWAFGGANSNSLAVYQPRGAASLAASKINLANPGTFDINGGVDPTFGAVGWTFNGTTQYLTSACPTSNKPCTYIVRLSTTNTTGFRSIIGCSDDSGLSFDVSNTTNVPRALEMNVALIGAGTAGFSASTDTVLAFTYSSSGVWTHYLNGSVNGTGTNSRTFTARTLVIAAQDTPQTAFYPGVIGGLAIYNIDLSATVVAGISAALAAVP